MLGITSRDARASSWWRSTDGASQRSLPVDSSRTFHPVCPSRTVPYTSHWPFGESIGFIAGVPSTSSGAGVPPVDGMRISPLVAPVRARCERGVTDVKSTSAPVFVVQAPYGPGAGAETNCDGKPLLFSNSRWPWPVATS